MRKVYLHEFNILMSGRVYLPNVSGMLRAYAETQAQIKENYQFMPFLFVREQPRKIIDAWENPSVVAFSSSMWNHQLNLALAKSARALFPEVLIVFGGPHVPQSTEEFLEKNPFIDVVVRGEGEVTFSEVLISFLEGRDFSRVNGVVYRDSRSGKCIRTPDRGRVDVNQFPSPYLAGFYDELLRKNNGVEYQMILETNRGCPFCCSFCFWGNGIPKIRTFDIGRIKEEIDWAADRKISYVFGADANFGMMPRDKDIAELFVAKKKLSGYPRAFRVCYGKNATDRVFEVAKLLEESRLTTGVTVSFQSTDRQTLINIGRSNIKLDAYRDLLRRYRSEKIRVYTELVLGLPGETYESFSKGIEEVFQAGLYDQVGIFLCEALPNTRMTDPEYASLHGIEVKRIELAEPHALRRSPDEVEEYEDIVVATRTMPPSDWKRALTLAWMTQTLHGLKLGFFVALYLFQRFGIKYTELFEYLVETEVNPKRFPVFARERTFHAEYLDGLLHGKPQCVFIKEFGDISWQIEEATFLRISRDLAGFYCELEPLVSDFLNAKGAVYSCEELKDVVRYQFARMAKLHLYRTNEFRFSFNVPEYFDRLLKDLPTAVEARHQALIVDAKDYKGNKKEFSRQVIWFGRRDCRALEPVTWY